MIPKSSRGRPKGRRNAAPTKGDTAEAMRLLKHRAAAGDATAAGWLVLCSLAWESRDENHGRAA